MTTYNAQPPGDAQRSSASYVTDQDEQARKRTAIGLSPHRETAPSAVQRPPDAGSRFAQWLLVVCLAMLIVSVVLLLVSRTMDPNTTWARLLPFVQPKAVVQVQKQPATAVQTAAVAAPPGYGLWLSEEFSAPSVKVPEYTVPGQLAGAVLPQLGVYRLDVWPGQLGWTLFDISALPAYWFETSAKIDAQTPSSAGGLIGRFGDSSNFDLFTVDGDGQLAVDMWKDGEKFVLQPPTTSAIVNGAGKANRLALEDNGKQMRFYVNQALLYTVAEPVLPAGRAGVAALSTGDQIAAVEFDWVRIYTPQ